MVDRLVDGGVTHVLLFGGEPGLRRDCIDIAVRTRSRGATPWVITNGTTLTSRDIYRLVEIDANIAVSLDGGDAETNDRVRGRGVFARVMATLSELMDARASIGATQPLQANFCLMRSNMAGAVQALQCLVDHGVQVISFSALLGPLPARGHSLKEEELSAAETVRVCHAVASEAARLRITVLLPLPERVLDELRRSSPGARIETTLEQQCAGGLHSVFVTSDGHLVPCGYEVIGDGSGTSLIAKSFTEIYHSDEFTAFLADAHDPRLVEKLDPRCRTCDYYAHRKCLPFCPLGRLRYRPPAELCAAAAPVPSDANFTAMARPQEWPLSAIVGPSWDRGEKDRVP